MKSLTLFKVLNSSVACNLISNANNELKVDTEITEDLSSNIAEIDIILFKTSDLYYLNEEEAAFLNKIWKKSLEKPFHDMKKTENIFLATNFNTEVGVKTEIASIGIDEKTTEKKITEENITEKKITEENLNLKKENTEESLLNLIDLENGLVTKPIECLSQETPAVLSELLN